MRLAIVQGTRPEIIKNYSIVRALCERREAFEILHTGQHHDKQMAGDIYNDMGYSPSRTLPGSYRIGRAIDWLQRTYRRDKVTHVLVNGDTAASIAGALAAMYVDIPVSHVEAGLRSRDPCMPEERNRIMVDAIASSLFAYTNHEMAVLRQSPDIRGRVFLEGNTTVDLLHDFSRRIETAPLEGPYIYVTAHRKELTQSRQRLGSICAALRNIAMDICPVIFPIHPRTRDALRKFQFRRDVLGSVHVVDPLRTFESLALIKHAAAVLTDSGCIQEEAYILRTPCITMRENTERHLTVTYGANRISGFGPGAILDDVRWALSLEERTWPSIYGEPGAGRRIVSRIAGDAIEAPADLATSFA